MGMTNTKNDIEFDIRLDRAFVALAQYLRRVRGYSYLDSYRAVGEKLETDSQFHASLYAYASPGHGGLLFADLVDML